MKLFSRSQRASMPRLVAVVSWLCVLSRSHAFLAPSRAATSPSPTTTSSLNFFFGNNSDDSDKENKQLSFFPKLSTTNTDVKFESLTTFITTWSEKFEEDRKGMGLTTPVKVSPLPDKELAEGVEEQGGVRIIFQPTKTAYKSKDEEDATREGKSEKKKKVKEGGVEIRVEKLGNGEVQLIAKRCEVDEDTMIKEMSEETIVSQLKNAIDAWKKQ